MKKKRINFDLIAGVLFLILSIVYYVAATKLPKSKLFDIGADFVPRIYGVGLALLSVAFIVNGIIKLKKQVTAETEPEKKPEEYPIEYDRVLRTFAVFVLYILLLKPVGFVITTFVFLLVEMILFAPDGKKTGKHILLYLGISLVSSIGLYFAFRNGFHVLLPKGILNL